MSGASSVSLWSAHFLLMSTSESPEFARLLGGREKGRRVSDGQEHVGQVFSLAWLGYPGLSGQSGLPGSPWQLDTSAPCQPVGVCPDPEPLLPRAEWSLDPA